MEKSCIKETYNTTNALSTYIHHRPTVVLLTCPASTLSYEFGLWT